jgi:hypothetical protein
MITIDNIRYISLFLDGQEILCQKLNNNTCKIIDLDYWERRFSHMDFYGEDNNWSFNPEDVRVLSEQDKINLIEEYPEWVY